MNRYSRLDNQSPAVEAMEANDINVGRSAHDCSHIHNGNTLIGLLAPVLTMEVVLNEDIDINIASLIEFRNPSTRPLFNSFRVYFHGYFNSLTDNWEGAKNWLDKGRSGQISLLRPNLIYHTIASWSSEGGVRRANSCTPMSLLNFMGLPAQAFQTDCGFKTPEGTSYRQRKPIHQFLTAVSRPVVGSGSNQNKYDFTQVSYPSDYFPADVCMCYQRNWRDYYANKNLLQNNKYWFPDNEDHFILSYSCENAVAINYEDEDFSSSVPDESNRARQIFINLAGDFAATSGSTSDPNLFFTPEPNNPSTVSPSAPVLYELAPNLSAIKFRQFRGDRFTTASPFPDLLRGDLPVLQLTQDNFVRLGNPSDGRVLAKFDGRQSLSSESPDMKFFANGTAQSASVSSSSSPTSVRSLLVPESSVTMSDIYTLETLTAFRRKMGMTNGDYSEMMEAQFGVKPKVRDHKGTYIGGFYQDFAISSVTQKSESATTPLGTKAGQGISSGQGRIGHFHTTDFGWIQVYMSIMPDVYYTQGKPRQFSKRSNLEMYFPLFNNLPAQAIRNDELWVSGLPDVDSSPFAFEDRYAEFKSISNRVSGLMGLPVTNAPFDTARVIARRFSSTPALNHLFVTAVPENIDMSVFSVVDEPPFDFSLGFSIRRVFPGPYTAVEGSLSSPKLNA